MSYRRTNDGPGQEVEPSTAGATGGRDLAAPSGLQLDLLCAVGRLEQVKDELDAGREEFAMWLLYYRVIECDARRLRGYLTPETLAWEKEMNDVISAHSRGLLVSFHE